MQVWIRNPYPSSKDDTYRQQWLPSHISGHPLWVPGEIQSLGSGATVDLTVTTTLHPRISMRVPIADVLPMNSVTSLDNLCDFTYLHEAAVVYNTMRRFLEGRYVTKAALLTLAVNPCRVPSDETGFGLLDPIVMARYHGRVSNRILESLPPSKRAALTLGPHLYEVAEGVVAGLRNELLNHGVVFMGDQGSGKSESFKHTLQYLLCMGPLEQQGVVPGSAATTLVQNAAAAVASGRSVAEVPALLGSPDLDAARADCARRRGPLGSVRNPWVTSAPSFNAASASPSGATAASSGFLTSGSGSTSSTGGFGGSSAAVGSGRSTDFYSDDAGPAPNQAAQAQPNPAFSASFSPAMFAPQHSAASAPSASAHLSSRTAAPASKSSVSSINPLKQLAVSMPKFSRMLLSAQTVIESFGCAAIAGSPNSSRFARSVRLYCDANGSVVGGRLDASLLEGRRVLGAALDPRSHGIVRQGNASQAAPGLAVPEGRNFHIFYQLLAGAPRDTRSQLHLGSQSDYLCLHQRVVPPIVAPSLGGNTAASSSSSGAPASPSAVTASSSASIMPVQYVHGAPLPVRSLGVPSSGAFTFSSAPSAATSSGSDSSGSIGEVSLSAYSTSLFDGEEFSATCKALTEVGIEPQTQVEICRLLSALLMAGNLRFNDGTSADGAGAQLATPSEAQLLADLLGIDRQLLCDVLTKRSRGSVNTGSGAKPTYGAASPGRGDGGSSQSRNVAWTNKRAPEARAAVDGITIALYDRLFSWIVERINGSIEKACGGQAALAAVAANSAPPGQTEPLYVCLFDGPGLEGALTPTAELSMFQSMDNSTAAAAVVPGGDGSMSWLNAGAGNLSVDVRSLRGFDTLCSNYASERVHDLFLSCVFRGEAGMYEAEGVDVASSVSYDDNAHICELVDNRRGGLVSCLDEASVFARSSDASFVSNLSGFHKRNPALLRPTILAPAPPHQSNDNALSLTAAAAYSNGNTIGGAGAPQVVYPGSSKDASFILTYGTTSMSSAVAQQQQLSASPYSSQQFSQSQPLQQVQSASAAGFDPSLVFGIRHTGGTVLYSAAGFLAMNKSTADRLDTDILAALSTTSVPFIRELLGLDASSGGSGSDNSASTVASALVGQATGQSAAARYIDSVSRLLQPLSAPSVVPSFVRCIKPNAQLQPGYVDPALIHSQLVYSGVLHGLVLHHSGYSYKASFSDFYERYVILVQHASSNGSQPSSRVTASGGVVASKRLVYPPPRGVDLRDLCRELLAAVMMHPAFAGQVLDLKRNVQFGRSRVFLKRHLADMLESLRESRLHTMDKRAVRIQAAWRGRRVRRDMAVIWEGVRRLQASFRAAHARQQWLRVRYAALLIQAAAKRWLIRRAYLAQLTAAKQIQRFFRSQRKMQTWRNMRKGVHDLHALARGYIVRCHVMRMLAAVSRLQGIARMFVAAARMRRLRNAAAAAFQSAWRGYRFRVDHEEVLAYMAVKRVLRAQATAAMKVQAAWRGARVRTRYNQLRVCAVFVQRWWKTHLAVRSLAIIKISIVRLQAIIRGFLAKIRVSRMRTLRMVADELWRVHLVRGRELVELSKATVEDALQPLPANTKLVVAAAAGVTAPLGAGVSTGASVNRHPGATKSGSAVIGPRPAITASGLQPLCGASLPSSSLAAGSSSSSSNQAGLHGYSGTLVLDVDTLSDTSLAHPGTLSRAVSSLEMDLRAAGTRIAGIGLGSSHAAIVTDAGHMYTWGFGDRGQCGHGKLNGETKPRLVEGLLSEKDAASGGSAAAGDGAADGGGGAGGGRKGSSAAKAADASAPGAASSSTALARMIVTPLRVRSVACGNEHTVAMSDAGNLYSFGGNRRGQLGLGHNEAVATPMLVRISMKDADAAALPAPLSLLQSTGQGGQASGPGSGAQGDGVLNDLTRIVEVAAGAYHTIALTSAGLVFAWGAGDCLAQGVFSGTGDCATPQPVRHLMKTRVRHISSGPSFVAVVTNSGDVYTWGQGRDGQLGVGEDVYHRKAKPIPAARPTVSIAGSNKAGSNSPTNKKQSGKNASSPTQQPAAAMPGPASTVSQSQLQAQAGGGYEYVAGKFRPRYIPTLIESFATFEKHSRITQVACGARHCIALSSTGRVYTWGSNSHAQLGLGCVGPVTEDVLRKHGAPIPTLPRHTQADTRDAQGKPIVQPRPYVASPIWIAALEQHHAVSAVAGSRSSAIMTDMRECYAWGSTRAPWPTVDTDTILVRASNIGSGAGGAVSSGSNRASSPSPPGSRRSSVSGPSTVAAKVPGRPTSGSGGVVAAPTLPGSSRAAASAAAGTLHPTSIAAAKVAAQQIAQNPIYLVESGRGPPESCVFPSPVEVNLATMPGRTARKIIGAHSGSASLLAVQYTQVPVSDVMLRDAALARAVAAPGKSSFPSHQQLASLPTPAGLMAALLSEADVSIVSAAESNSSAAAAAQQASNASSAASASAAVAAARSPRAKSVGPASPSSSSIGGGGAASGGAATPSATSALLASLASQASADGPTAAAAAAERKRAIQSALLRGVAGLPDSSVAAPTAAAAGSGGGVSRSVSARKGASSSLGPASSRASAFLATLGSPAGSSSSSAAANALTSPMGVGKGTPMALPGADSTRSLSPSPKGGAGHVAEHHHGRFAISMQQASPPLVPAALSKLHPAVVRAVGGLARDPAGCSAIMGLSPDQVRAMAPMQIAIVAERLMELSGGTNPGAMAGSALVAAGAGGGPAAMASPAAGGGSHAVKLSRAFDTDGLRRAFAAGQKASASVASAGAAKPVDAAVVPIATIASLPPPVPAVRPSALYALKPLPASQRTSGGSSSTTSSSLLASTAGRGATPKTTTPAAKRANRNVDVIGLFSTSPGIHNAPAPGSDRKARAAGYGAGPLSLSRKQLASSPAAAAAAPYLYLTAPPAGQGRASSSLRRPLVQSLAASASSPGATATAAATSAAYSASAQPRVSPAAQAYISSPSTARRSIPSIGRILAGTDTFADGGFGDPDAAGGGQDAEAFGDSRYGGDLRSVLDQALATAAAEHASGLYTSAAAVYASSPLAPTANAVYGAALSPQQTTVQPASASQAIGDAEAHQQLLDDGHLVGSGADVVPNLGEAEDIADRVASLQKQLEAVRLRSAAVMALQNRAGINGDEGGAGTRALPLLPATPMQASAYGYNPHATTNSNALTSPYSSYLASSPALPFPPTSSGLLGAASSIGSQASSAGVQLTPAGRAALLSRLQAELHTVSSEVEQ